VSEEFDEDDVQEALAELLGDDLDVLTPCRTSKGTIVFLVNAGDTFVYACADAEEAKYDDIVPLKNMITGSKFGQYRWLALRHNEKPLREIIKLMKDAGEWDDNLEALPDNECNKVVAKW